MRLILLTLAGSLAGLLVGALPGLSVTMATALLVSVTYTWEAADAISLIMGIYVVGVFSGALSAILLNIPGAPSSVITTLDGYPMAKNGKGARAIRIAAVWSFIGSVAGFFFLWILAKPFSLLALEFKPMDYFLLSLFGLLSIGSLTAEDPVKGWVSAVIGLFLSLVGMDSVAGFPRLTFGIKALKAGVSIVPALIGLFGFSQVLVLIENLVRERKTGKQTPAYEEKPEKQPDKNGGILAHWKTGIPAAVIGTLVGILPGAGTPVASLTAYGLARRFVRKPAVPFGSGAEEGIVASEAANNAVVGGALIPTLTLGVPGDAVTAILLAVFTVHGLEPGPLFLDRSGDAFRIILLSGLTACLFLLPIGLWIGPKMAKILTIPKIALIPLVILLCFAGAYGTNERLSDVVIMLLFGAAAFFLKKRGFPAAPVTLGLVLGDLMDANFRRAVSLALSADNKVQALFGRPITVVLLLMIALLVLRECRRGRKNPDRK